MPRPLPCYARGGKQHARTRRARRGLQGENKSCLKGRYSMQLYATPRNTPSRNRCDRPGSRTPPPSAPSPDGFTFPARDDSKGLLASLVAKGPRHARTILHHYAPSCTTRVQPRRQSTPLRPQDPGDAIPSLAGPTRGRCSQLYVPSCHTCAKSASLYCAPRIG
jgi:hypothetical protein